MKRQRSITDFLPSKIKPQPENGGENSKSNVSLNAEAPSQASQNQSILSKSLSDEFATPSCSRMAPLPGDTTSCTKTAYYHYDIGNVVQDVNIVSNEEKHNYLKNTWTPDDQYHFPFSSHNKKTKIEKRYLNKNHICAFDWVAYSHSQQGLFCKYCVLFCTTKEKLNLNKFVIKPETNFAKLTGKDGSLENHNRLKYHQKAIVSGQTFLRVYRNPELDIRNELNTARLEQAKENRERLKPIIKTIILCGQQNIPLRGHRDHGELIYKNDFNENSDSFSGSLSNEGNFRELLKYRIDAGDKILENHLKTATSKATYISKRTQNELIECCGEEILGTIVKRIMDAKYYSIIFDETTDISNISQLSVIIR